MIRRRILTILIPLALTAGACTDDTVDIGHRGELLSDYAGTWVGYTEAFSFDSDSDRIEVALDAEGQGYLVVGNDPMPAPLPLTDPNIGYVPSGSAADGPIPGFRYPVYDAHVEIDRVRLKINYLEPYRSWCELQTSFPADETHNSYQCVPNWGAECDIAASRCVLKNPATGEAVPVDFGKLHLCTFYPVCACDASGCTIPPPRPQLDAALENGGTKLTGTFLTGPGQTTVRMQRQ